MGNCLITKLKTVVNNNGLMRMGEYIINIINAPSEQQSIKFNNNTTIILPNDDVVDLQPNEEYMLQEGTYNIRVFSKYNSIPQFTGTSNTPNTGRYIKFNVSDFKYYKNDTTNDIIWEFCNIVEGDVKDLPNVNIKRLQLEGCSKITGTILDIAYKYPSIKLLYTNNTSISGNIVDIAELPFNIQLRMPANLQGELKDLIDIYRQRGIAAPTDGLALVYLNISKVTLFGNNVKNYFTGVLNYVKWDDSTISVSDNKTEWKIYNNNGQIIE